MMLARNESPPKGVTLQTQKEEDAPRSYERHADPIRPSRRILAEIRVAGSNRGTGWAALILTNQMI